MRAKEDGDYEKTINVALDMWDRFGLSYLVADALQDGFIVWAKASQYQSEDAANLALDLHRRARMELPASLSEVLAEPNPPHPDIPSDPVGDWVLLFKQAELFSGAIAPERLRMTAGELFDGLCRLPPTKRRDYQSLLGRLHEKYGVGDMGAAQDGVYS